MKPIACMAAAFTLASPSAAQTIPVRTLTVAAATDSGVLFTVSGIRSLPGGRVLVGDDSRRRMLSFDSTLTKFSIVLDTAGGGPNKYGAGPAALIRYLGDSSLFADRGSQAFVVIDGTGNVARVMAPPRPSDMRFIASTNNGLPGVDPKGRLIYRTQRLPSTATRVVPEDGANKMTTSMWPDSAPILRADFDTRGVDTIAMIRIPTQRTVTVSPQPGMTVDRYAYNPLPSTDEWVLLPDGTIAILRVQDYHIDWMTMDGTMTSSPKMPFDWKPLTAEAKQQLIDSAKKVDADRRAKNPPPKLSSRDGTPSPSPMPFIIVEPSDLPDFYPPVRQGQVKADLDGNVWILPSTSKLALAGLVFDVVNRKGEIFERVQLPVGRNLVGFGPGGAIYLSYAATGRVLLERARMVR
jgi:hypothetical protein